LTHKRNQDGTARDGHDLFYDTKHKYAVFRFFPAFTISINIMRKKQTALSSCAWIIVVDIPAPLNAK